MRTSFCRAAALLMVATGIPVATLHAQLPEGLKVTGTTPQSVTLAWKAADNASSYQVYRDGQLYRNVHAADTTLVVSGLQSFDIYCFTVKATYGNSETVTQSNPVYVATPETQEQRDQRMAWWREARFGMFIHWGPYSALAGHYSGPTLLQPQENQPWIQPGGVMKDYYSCFRPEWIAADGTIRTNPLTGKTYERGGYAEWIMFDAQIPREEYLRRTRSDFHAEKYDAKEWVRMAKEAGMKYIVITSKHHDGIALFPTHGDGHSIQADTDIRRDVLRELVDEARKAGLKIGFYYSQALDWNDLGGMDYVPQNETPDHRAPYDAQAVYNQKVIRHVQTIIRDYGVDILWWDMGAHSKPEFRYQVMKAIKQIPGTQRLIFNDRMEDHMTGDFKTPEQSIPDTPSTGDGTDWETCMTLNDNWGYAAHDFRWKTTHDLIQKLIDITSKGGNFLLNIGPKADGTFPQESIDRLAEVGKWMAVNGEAIYATQPSPFSPQLDWGRATRKTVNGKEVLYLHVFAQHWPKDGKLVVPRLPSASFGKAYLLSDTKQKALPMTTTGEAVVLRVPAKAVDPVSTTIVVEVK